MQSKKVTQKKLKIGGNINIFTCAPFEKRTRANCQFPQCNDGLVSLSLDCRRSCSRELFVRYATLVVVTSSDWEFDAVLISRPFFVNVETKGSAWIETAHDNALYERFMFVWKTRRTNNAGAIMCFFYDLFLYIVAYVMNVKQWRESQG